MGATSHAIDVTIRDPLAPSYRRIAQRSLGVACAAEREKQLLYGAEAQRQGVHFLGVGLEALGGWGPQAQALVRLVSRHAEIFTEYTAEEARGIFVRAVSAAVQADNAKLLIATYQKATAAQVTL
jgi:hypothetical protein